MADAPVYALFFPGQASQAVGMGRDLRDGYEVARAMFAQADEVLGFELSRICFEGPEEELRRTAVTQPAIFVHSCIAAALLADAGIAISCTAGHSLGEYSALVAAGALDYAVGLELVGRRGRLMQEAGEGESGAMAAILGLEDGEVVELCRQASSAGTVVAANFNAPGQLVVSGEPAGVERLGELAREAGAKRVVPLPVSGAFHSPLMQPAAAAMADVLQQAPIRAPRVPVYTNVAAAPIEDVDVLRQHLIEQMTSPVRWTETVRAVVEAGAEQALEVGPGAVLRGLGRRIAPQLKIAAAGKAADIETLSGKV
jgi:[acyl-carrier-protein] S-malonyltransferase